MKFLKSIKIENFKGFGEERNEIEFAYPESDGSKSGLTFIVGPNNAGKSTIFEALLKYQHHAYRSFYNSELTAEKPPRITIFDSFSNAYILTKNENTEQIAGIDFGAYDGRFFYLTVQRSWVDQFGGSGVNDIYSAQQSVLNELLTNPHGVDRQLPILLKQIRAGNMNSEFIKMMKKIIPDFKEWRTDREDSQSNSIIYYLTSTGKRHRVSLLGSGVNNLFKIIASLVLLPENSIFIIDEPELSLHPSAQKALFKILYEFSFKHQIIISTHSPYFLDWRALEKGARLVRMDKKEDKYCLAYPLNQDLSLYKSALSTLNDFSKPHALDTVAKEAFFARNIVFVEGQEDVGLLKKFIEDESLNYDFEFFGYGANGAGNIPAYLTLAKDLGLNAAAIFDGDKLDDVKKCRDSFQDFKVLNISTPDIRDKWNRDENGRENENLGISKTGLFDHSGNIKSGSAQELKDLLSEINDFFNASIRELTPA